jgi:hypothetical protein
MRAGEDYIIVYVMEDKCLERRWCELSGIYSGIVGAAHLSRALMVLVAKKCKEHFKVLDTHPPPRPSSPYPSLNKLPCVAAARDEDEEKDEEESSPS